MDEFKKIVIDYDKNIFGELEKSARFEEVTNGRVGVVLLDNRNGLIPIVRTTTCYQEPAQSFSDIHYGLIDKIKEKSGIADLEFNNGLFELYTSEYRKMGYHSDQALDLADDSYIALYSCYNSDHPVDIRTLKVKNKETGVMENIKLEHNSVVIFSTSINKRYLHKIILEQCRKDDIWIGLTLRFSKTFIRFDNQVPYINHTNQVLELASDQQRNEFYRLRSQENKGIDFEYPKIDYTISPSDRLPVENN